MKGVLFWLVAIWMMVTTVSAQNLDEEKTITMSCVKCDDDDYFELEIDVDEIIKMVLSCNIVSETCDSLGIRTKFYEEFTEKSLPGVTSIFLTYRDDFDTLSIVLRKNLTGETCTLYVSTVFGWLQSVDTQEFYAFDRLLWLSKHGGFNKYFSPILRENELFR